MLSVLVLLKYTQESAQFSFDSSLFINLPHGSTARLLFRLHSSSRDNPLVWVPTAAHQQHLVLLLAPEAEARRPLLEALAVIRPRLVGLELHHRGGLLLPLLLRSPPRGPGRRHPAGEWGARASRGAGRRGGSAWKAQGGRVSPGAGDCSDAGQGASAGHWSPGAGEEAPPLSGRPPLSMEPASRSPPLPPAAVAAAAAAAAGGRAKLEARATRRQLQ